MIPQLECPPTEIICPFTELSILERLSQLVNQRVNVLSNEKKTSGLLHNVQFLNDNTLFSVNDNRFVFSEIQRMILLDESVNVNTFNALIKPRSSRKTKRVRLITIGSGYAEFVSINNKINRRVIVPRRRLKDIICVAKRFTGHPEKITVVERLRSLIGTEIGIQIPPRGQVPAAGTLVDVNSDSVVLQDESGRVFEVNFKNNPVIFEIPGNFFNVLSLVTIQSRIGEINLTLNLNRLGLDFIEVSDPQPPFLYFLIPLNRFITVECVEEEE